MTGVLRRWLPAALTLGAIVAVWEWAANRGHLPVSVPAPSSVWRELGASRDTLWFHTEPTIYAAGRGFIAATAVAFALALVVVLWPRAAQSVYTTAVIVSSIPLIALTPVLVLWLDRGDTVRTAVAALAGLFPILVGCVQGLRATDSRAEELFTQLAARRVQHFRLLALPSSLPYVFAGLKAASASAVLGAIIAEWSGGGGTRGLGQMMTNALFGFNVPLTWLTILTAAALAIGSYVVTATAERIVVRWDHDLVDAT
jgi:NitT/TauT family transport system permease protein